MKKTRNLWNNRRGISPLFIAIYVSVIAVILISTIFLGLETSRNSVSAYLKNEQERQQESILIYGPKGMNLTGSASSVVSHIRVNNTGSITVRIRALYINQRFVCDPSTYQDTYIAPKENKWISLISSKYPIITLDTPTLQADWTVVTERGTNSTDKGQYILFGHPGEPHHNPNEFYIGPLMILYDMFNWRSGTGQWESGWSIPDKTSKVTWRLLLSNVDTRSLTLSDSSFFDLVANTKNQNQEQKWFIDLSSIRNKTLVPGQYYYLEFTMDVNGKRQDITQLNPGCSCLNFLTLFGNFEDANHSAFGQTIPFEAVLITGAPSMTISANPTTITAGSGNSSQSTIAVTIIDEYGNPVPNELVSLSTTLGTLSVPVVTTNNEGVATVTLDAGSIPGIATVTARSLALTKSATVTILGPRINIVADPTTIIVGSGSSSKSFITATVLDINGNPMPGQPVSFTTTLGSLSSSSATTGPTGTATVILTAGPTAGVATVTATSQGTSRSTSVTIANSVTIASTISGRTDLTFVRVDGANITTPQPYSWTAGSTHTLSAIAIVSDGTGKQYVFTGWSDGGAATHTITIPPTPITYTANYKTQFYLTMSTNFGSVSPSTGWYDAGSILTISATAPNSVAGEQYVWNTWTGQGTRSYSGPSNPATTAVIINSPITETASWTHQYRVNVTQTGLTNDASGTIVTVLGDAKTYNQLPNSTWVNANTVFNYGFNSQIPAITGKRYTLTSITGPGSGFNVTAPTTVTGNYKAQYQVPAQYAVADGSNPSATVLLSGSQNGSSSTWPLTNSAQQIWLDEGTTWTVSNPVPSTPTNESWSANSGTSGTVSNTTVVNPTYYHQYRMTLYYSVSGDGAGYAAPTFNANQYGSPIGQTLTTTATNYWFDSDSPWTITNPLTGSNASERWRTIQSTVGTIAASQSMAFTYYHQYKMTLYYSLQGGGSPTAPTFTANQYGSSAGQSLNITATDYWFDSGPWSVTNPLGGSSSSERWQAGPPTSGNTSAQTTDFAYYHQYNLTVTATPNDALGGAFRATYTQNGAVILNQQHTTTWNSWADSGTTATVSSPDQSRPKGLKFSSYSPSASVIMDQARTITLVYS